MPSTTPALVATPFPPLNPTKTEKTWPITAITPQRSGKSSLVLTAGASTSTGTAPFAMSISATGTANFHPMMRKTFVAPRFLLPCSRRSMPPNHLPAR